MDNPNGTGDPKSDSLNQIDVSIGHMRFRAIMIRQALLMMFISVSLALGGLLLRPGMDLSWELLRSYGSWAMIAFGTLVATYGYYVLFRHKLFTRFDGTSFLDIDRSSHRETTPNEESRQIVAEIRRLASAVSADRADVDAIVDRVIKAQAAAIAPASPPDSFHGHMAVFVRVLEEKSKLADEKASVLLDRGVAYSKFGIGFFIVAIITWQVLAWWHGFQPQLIFGIASSAVLFVFLQFLSSWFLKQYRHFVEVSTYLIEIKSVFDRYALLHMLSREAPGAGHPDAAPISALVSALKEEMKWPRARPGFTDDVYYAKDAVGATEEIVKIVRMGGPAKEAPSR